jgi:hypothetical protein
MVLLDILTNGCPADDEGRDPAPEELDAWLSPMMKDEGLA